MVYAWTLSFDVCVNFLSLLVSTFTTKSSKHVTSFLIPIFTENNYLYVPWFPVQPFTSPTRPTAPYCTPIQLHVVHSSVLFSRSFSSLKVANNPTMPLHWLLVASLTNTTIIINQTTISQIINYVISDFYFVNIYFLTPNISLSTWTLPSLW